MWWVFKFSIPLIDVSAFKSLEGTSCVIKSFIPPPCYVLSTVYGGVKPSIKNWFEQSKAYNFLRDFNKTSTLFPITCSNISNLFLKEFMLTCSNIAYLDF